jgi:hypothetical protein
MPREDLNSAEVMARLLTSGRQKLAGNVVWFASDGGDIDAGMALGRLLRRLGVFALVGKDDRCLSACVFAFMGGERRSVAGQLGIHRPYFPFTQAMPDRPARFRHLQKTLRGDESEQAAAGNGGAADGSGSMPKNAAPAGRSAGRPTGGNAQDPGTPPGKARGVPGST